MRACVCARACVRVCVCVSGCHSGDSAAVAPCTSRLECYGKTTAGGWTQSHAYYAYNVHQDKRNVENTSTSSAAVANSSLMYKSCVTSCDRATKVILSSDKSIDCSRFVLQLLLSTTAASFDKTLHTPFSPINNYNINGGKPIKRTVQA